MGVSIAQAASTLGVSEKTIRRRIKRGFLKAQLVGTPPRYDIPSEEVDIVQETSNQGEDNGVDVGMGNVYPRWIEVLREQLQEKDRQIKELHILLQGAHEQTGRMLESGGVRHRKWWPFW